MSFTFDKLDLNASAATNPTPMSKSYKYVTKKKSKSVRDTVFLGCPRHCPVYCPFVGNVPASAGAKAGTGAPEPACC